MVSVRSWPHCALSLSAVDWVVSTTTTMVFFRSVLWLFTLTTVYPQKDHNGKRPQWKKSMGIKTTVYSKTAWTILVIRPHQKRRPLVGMATKQVMPHHFFNNFAKGGSPVYKDLRICYSWNYITLSLPSKTDWINE